MEKTILYPFSILEDNSISYQKTMSLAQEMDARVVCFTVVKNEETLDDAYLHLLQLNGYYKSNSNNWQSPNTKVERAIKVGDHDVELTGFLASEKIDVLIRKTASDRFEEGLWDQWINEQKGQLEIFRV